MRTTAKIVLPIFIIFTIYCAYSLYQTAVNHGHLIETKLKCKLSKDRMVIEKCDVYFVNVTFSIVNPSHLTIRVYVIEYSVYIFNTTSQKLEVLGSYSYAGKILDVHPSTKESINTSTTISGIYFDRLEWFELTNPLYRSLILIDGIFWLKIMPFEEIWTIDIK